MIVLALAACSGDDPPGKPPPDPECTQADGEICTIAGSGLRGYNGDGAALETHLFLPTAVAFEPDGHLLVVDFNNMTLRRLTDDGVLVTVVGAGVHAYAFDGIDALETAIENPVDAAVGDDGTIYIMELHGARVLSVDNTGWLTVFAGSPTNPGYEAFDGDGLPAREAGMSEAIGLAWDAGSLFISDTNNHAIRQVDPDGLMQTLAGNGAEGYADGVGATASFSSPQHLTARDGFVYVADQRNDALRRVEVATGEAITIADAADGLSEPQGVAVDELGRIYIADSGSHVIRRMDTDGSLEIVAGTEGVAGYAGDLGDALSAELSRPNNVAVHEGDLYIVDTFNDVVRVVYGIAR